MIIQETELDALIDDNLDKLRELYAQHYMGTDDDMPDAFDNWITNFTLEEIKTMI